MEFKDLCSRVRVFFFFFLIKDHFCLIGRVIPPQLFIYQTSVELAIDLLHCLLFAYIHKQVTCWLQINYRLHNFSWLHNTQTHMHTYFIFCWRSATCLWWCSSYICRETRISLCVLSSCVICSHVMFQCETWHFCEFLWTELTLNIRSCHIRCSWWLTLCVSGDPHITSKPGTYYTLPAVLWDMSQ